MKKAKILVLLMAALGSTAAFADSVWKWSNNGQFYYYRDNDGRVHYSDGSVSAPNQLWFDGGKAVYSANSAGPADKTGQYAIQAPKIDESKVGPAPTSPPTNAVLVMPGSNTGPVAGPQPTTPTYIVPTGQTAVIPSTTAVATTKKAAAATAPAPAVGGYVLGQPKSGTYIQGGNGTQIYYYRRNDGANVYVSP